MARGLTTDLLQWIGQVLYHEDDEFARTQGWQVRVGRFGLSRVYRHPAFDRLARCPGCTGLGLRAGAGCERCSGTGRVTLDQPSPGKEARR